VSAAVKKQSASRVPRKSRIRYEALCRCMRIAAMTVRRARWRPGNDPRDLAEGLGLRVIPSGKVRGAQIDGGALFFYHSDLLIKRNYEILHAVARFVLKELNAEHLSAHHVADYMSHPGIETHPQLEVVE